MNTVTFDFHTDGMRIEIEAGYENDGGLPIIGGIECTLRDKDGGHAGFDPIGLLVWREDCVGLNPVPLGAVIRIQAAAEAEKDITERQADEADRKSDQHKEDRVKPC